MATGSEILSYRPDARLAGGLNETPAGTGADILNPFNNTMQQLSAQRFQWDVNRYQQGIKDRDEILKLVRENSDATQGIDLLDQDKKVLEGKLNETNQRILDTVKKYGNPKSNLTAYSEIQKGIKDYQQAVQSAKTRAIMGKKLLTDAADETNAIDRQSMLQHYTKEFQQSDINHLPDPYFKRFKYDASLVAPDVPETQLSKKYEGDYEVITKGTPLSAFRYNLDAINTGSDNAKNLIQHQQTMYQDAANAGLLANPDYVKQVNAKLDQFNNTFGLKPGDYDFAKPLGEVDADGNVINPTTSPAEFARDMHILGKFKQTEEKNISKDKIALNKSKADIAQSYASAAASKANAAESYYNIQDKKATLQARIDDLNAKAEAAKSKNDAAQGTAYGAAASVLGLINQYDKVAPLTDFKGEANKAKLLREVGVSENAKFIEIPKSNDVARRLFADPQQDELKTKTIGREFKKSRFFMVRDGDNVKFVGIDDPSHITPSTIRVIDSKSAPSALIMSDNIFNPSDKDNMAMGLSDKIMAESLPGSTPSQSSGNDVLQIIKSGKAKSVTDPQTGEVYYQVGNDFFDAKGNIVQ